MPELSPQHIFSDHRVECEPGTVQVGNRCMPAAAIIGDDHQVGGHHFRQETGEYHMMYNNEEETPRPVFDDDGNDEDDFGDAPAQVQKAAQPKAEEKPTDAKPVEDK